METTQIDSFDIVGIKIRTANDGSAGKDLPVLWSRFMDTNLREQIPNKVDDSIYFLYSNYDSDHTQPYDAIIGCKVSSIQNVPDGMITHRINSGNMAKFVARGSLVKGEAIINKWFEIWKSDIDRTYDTDFEVYDHRAKDVNDAEVDIFISIK